MKKDNKKGTKVTGSIHFNQKMLYDEKSLNVLYQLLLPQTTISRPKRWTGSENKQLKMLFGKQY
jgi:hypothetical protein